MPAGGLTIRRRLPICPTTAVAELIKELVAATMTTDERIEALTQSVELLASFHRDSEARHETRFSTMMDVIERVAHLVENREHRIGGLEDQH
jgi:hypothetical protein